MRKRSLCHDIEEIFLFGFDHGMIYTFHFMFFTLLISSLFQFLFSHKFNQVYWLLFWYYFLKSQSMGKLELNGYLRIVKSSNCVPFLSNGTLFEFGALFYTIILSLHFL